MPYEDTFAYKLLTKFASMNDRIRHYSAIADLCPLPIFIAPRDGSTILYVNAAYRIMTGKCEEQLQDLNWLSVIHPEDREDALTAWQDYIKAPVDDIPLIHRHRYVNAIGHVIAALTYTTAVPNNGLIGYIVPTDCAGLIDIGIIKQD